MNEPQNLDYDVAIIGGGIAGLSTAWYLQQEAKKRESARSYAILEQSDRWGGKVQTETVNEPADAEFVIENGPDSFITQKPWALELVYELGLEERLLPANDRLRQVYVLNNGRPTPLPDGLMLMVPTEFRPFARSSLISWPGKLRMGLDLFISPRCDDDDETLADFITRRLGAEALHKLAEPLLSGIYNAEAEKQSMMACFPRFRAIERQYGSLIKGMLAARKARVVEKGAPPANGRHSLGMFVSLQGGMAELINALQSRLTGDCFLNNVVQRLEARSGGGYRLVMENDRELSACSVVLAVPAYAGARLLEDLAPRAAQGLKDIRYVNTGIVSLAFRRDELDHPLNGFGLVIPRNEKRSINAVTWTSTKFSYRAPEGYALLRVFFGGSRSPDAMALEDGEVVRVVRQELKEIMGVSAVPLFHRIYRWHRSTPQYDVGHLERVNAIEAALPQGLFVTGSPYRGIGIPDCVHQARNMAVQVFDQRF